MLTATRKALYFGAFIGLVATAAVAVGRIGTPSIAPTLLWAGVAAALAAGPGLIRRKAWPAAIVLVPLGAYLVLHAQLTPPASTETAGDVVAFYLDQLRDGAHAYATKGLPFRFRNEPELMALLAIVFYAAVTLAAFLALSLRRTLPAIVVGLILLGFGLTVDESGRLIWLALAFLVFAGALLTISRSLQRERWRSGDAFAGIATAIVAGVLALSLLGTTTVAQSTPWQDWRTWGSGTGTGMTLGFDWMQDYPDLLDPQRDGTVMKVKSPVASYWRANALDAFNGSSWFSSGTYKTRLSGGQTGGSYTYVVPITETLLPGRQVTQQVRLDSIYSDYLFTGGTLTSLTLERELAVRLNTVDGVQLDGSLGPKSDYAMTAVVPEVTPADLVGRGRYYPEHIRHYLALPFPTPAAGVTPEGEAAWRQQTTAAGDEEWLGLYPLDRRIVHGATDPYQIALRIEEYLRYTYSYSLTPPRTSFESPYASFLFSGKEGFCQQFAGSMAILLRFNGIPARVAVGFTSGQRDRDGWFVVGRNNAHAWVEAYFPEAGWVPFDPTPGRALPGPGGSSTSFGFTDPFAADGESGAGTGAGGVDLVNPRRLEEDPLASRGGEAVAVAEGPAVAGWIPAVLAIVLLVAGWPLTRAALRRARLHRGDPERRLRASVTLLVDDLHDYGLRVAPSQTLDETARLVRAVTGLDVAGEMSRVQAVLFGGREATAEDVDTLRALHRELRRRLRARHGAVAALRAFYGLPRPRLTPATVPTR